jgi:flagellar M-ring protein FliF
MPIIDHLSARAALTRLRAQVDRLRRSVISQRPAIRWGLALAAMLGLAAAGYWAATSMVPVGARYLASGRRFSSEDLNKICRVLEAQRIEYRCDDQHRIAIDADQFDQAAALVAKLDVGPRPIDEVRDQVNSWSVWFEGPREREQKEKLAREKMVESMIRKLDGVVWALVWINHPRASVWHRTAAKPTAFVYIETEGDRQLPFKVIQSIPEFLVGCEPDLTIGSITVMDHRGHRYLDPGNPSLGDVSRKRAREEVLSEQILEQLHYINGVRVQVRVTSPPASEPTATQVADKPPRAQTEGFKPAIGLNRPVDLEPEPPPSASVPVAVASPAAGKHEKGKILINVPRSFYFKAMIDKNENREPSEEELHKLALRTEKLIKTSVDLVVSESGSWEVTIETFPDDGPLARPAVLTSAADQRRKIVDWGILCAVGVLVGVSIVLTTRIQVARRPARLPEPIHKTRRYHADSASGPGPSERVRELIRRNPEAAASVLQRWTGQGSRVT